MNQKEYQSRYTFLTWPPKLVCPYSQDRLLISIKNLNQVEKIDKEAMKMTVEPGMYIRDVINTTVEVGLALCHGLTLPRPDRLVLACLLANKPVFSLHTWSHLVKIWGFKDLGS